MKTDTAPEVIVVSRMTKGQTIDLAAALAQGSPDDLSSEFAQFLIGKKTKIAKAVQEAIYELPIDTSENIKLWEKFFQFCRAKIDLPVKFNFSKAGIPGEQFSFGWIEPIPEGFTTNRGYEICQKGFPCWKIFNDLDVAITYNERSTTNDYVIRIRNRRESDIELQNISAGALRKQNIKSICLYERELLEAWFYWLTGVHLDVENVNLCAGSRGSDGGVPRARWCGGKFRVGCCRPWDAGPRLRARAVVSL